MHGGRDSKCKHWAKDQWDQRKIYFGNTGDIFAWTQGFKTDETGSSLVERLWQACELATFHEYGFAQIFMATWAVSTP